MMASQYLRVAAADLKTPPAQVTEKHRLEIVYFDTPPDTLPNSRPRPDFVRCACAFRLAGIFHGRARVEKGADGPVLAIETTALDLRLRKEVTMDYSLPLLRTIYRQIGQSYILGQARRYAGKGGRN